MNLGVSNALMSRRAFSVSLSEASFTSSTAASTTCEGRSEEDEAE